MYFHTRLAKKFEVLKFFKHMQSYSLSTLCLAFSIYTNHIHSKPMHALIAVHLCYKTIFLGNSIQESGYITLH